MKSVFYGLKTQNNMDIKLKYRAWAGEKHADIASHLTNSDIETFAIEFAEWLVKNCSIPAVSNLLCGSFEPDNKTSSATKCKCEREKWEHPNI